MTTKMKTLLVGMYDRTSTSIAPHILRSYAEQFEDIRRTCTIEVAEFSIFKDTPDAVAAAINERRPDLVGFSTYIWNHCEILQVLPKLWKDVKVVLGGPMVFMRESELIRDPRVDVVVTGEGEVAFCDVLRHFAAAKPLRGVSGITTRDFATSPSTGLDALGAIPSYYARLFAEFPATQWITIETARGCTSNCAFCTWGRRGMRYFPIERVLQDLDLILSQPLIRVICFADSQLLVNKPRALQILRHVIESRTDKRMIFEFNPEHLDEEVIQLLAQMSNHYFSLGLQTIDEAALRACGRPKVDGEAFRAKLKRVGELAHHALLTTDLIYGLPGDTIQGFRKSLEYVLNIESLEGVMLQRFIVLPGSRFFGEREKWSIVYDRRTFKILACKTWSEQDLSEAARCSLYVNIVFRNHRLHQALRAFALQRGETVLDTLEKFMRSLPDGVLPSECPGLTAVTREDHDSMELLDGHLVEQYPRIIRGFRKFSEHRFDHLLSDWKNQFSRLIVYPSTSKRLLRRFRREIGKVLSRTPTGRYIKDFLKGSPQSKTA